jgi:hypothetical protein
LDEPPNPTDWMRRLAGEATPELEHLRQGAALCGSSVNGKYSARFRGNNKDNLTIAPT